ncbi:hypothetical protein [Andreprevotia chitinilytica]|uniref:hypothetical protein n=1 Tax=Andreprevotia chitinilytica TaxID=396808 RepID=UPI0006917980|nr:hypothetical protein [Andreprevotia chitinilytica]
MLRIALLCFALLLTVAGAYLCVVESRHALPMLIWGAILSAAVLFERWRYRQKHQPGPGEWQETAERFEDPESGQLMQVLFNPKTGERRYVPVKSHDR